MLSVIFCIVNFHDMYLVISVLSVSSNVQAMHCIDTEYAGMTGKQFVC